MKSKEILIRSPESENCFDSLIHDMLVLVDYKIQKKRIEKKSIRFLLYKMLVLSFNNEESNHVSIKTTK